MKVLAATATTFGGAFLLLLAVLAYISEPLDGEPFAVVNVVDRTKDFDNTLPFDAKTYDPRRPVIAINSFHEAMNAGAAAGNIAHKVRFGGERRVRNAKFETPLGRLQPVPIAAFVEYSGYGPLPKISQDGRQPSEVYARPAQFAAQHQAGDPPKIAIMINGLGLSSVETHDVIQKLPGSISLAFGPYGANLQGWIRKARDHGHEVLLQIPLEPYDYPDNDPGPHTLLTGLAPRDNLSRLRWLMGRFSGYMGLTNAKGAKFMTAPEAIRPIWRELKKRGLAYVDTSRTSRSAGENIAGEVGLQYGTAEVVIDNEKTREDIDAALQKLERLATERGLAVGVGSSLPITIGRIEKWSKTLAKKGIVLVPLSTAIKTRQRT